MMHILRLVAIFLLVSIPLRAHDPTVPVWFADSGYTTKGDWFASVEATPNLWTPAAAARIRASLSVSRGHVEALQAAGIKVDGFVVLVTAERTFDAGGWMRLPSDEKMSTLLTPTGLPIEGGWQGAITNRFGYGFKTPVDLLMTKKLTAVTARPDGYEVGFDMSTKLPDDLPPGLYRLRVDYGVTVGTRYYNLNGESFSMRGFPQGRPCESNHYSPLIPASAKDVSGKFVDAESIQPRIPWILLGAYNSNGYSGVVADEDQPRFGLSGRNLIQDDVVLPLYSDTGSKLSYSLEPRFPADTIEARSNLQWNFQSGELSITITGPDGKADLLGTAPFVAASGQWPTTRNSRFTAWQPPAYGKYVVKATGWINDRFGNRYEGGGTYQFWIAKRMTLATATFQGQPYPVGNRYGRDIGFAPAFPADVEVSATLYAWSDPKQARVLSFKGKASPAGVFSTAQGNKSLTFDAPGEYVAKVLATYTDRNKDLWVCSMRHTGVVYAEDSAIVARGKKVKVGNEYAERGHTYFEGYVDTTTNTNYLDHINFPYNSGDVLLIASEQQGANKIEPVLLWEDKAKPAAWQRWYQSIGRTNLQLKTSNGYSPHLFPEYITEWAYYYAGAPRPGFMGRFLVAEDGTRAPYWPTSPNSFGGQINASPNGDLPGDIYRLIGGIVLRRADEKPVYAGYMANAFLLPKRTNDNRVVEAGSEDVPGSDGSRARFYLVGLRPGMTYETGHVMTAVAQIDPMVPALVRFTLQYPDGKKLSTEGVGDSMGSWAGKDRFTLDQPGLYRYWMSGEWNGYQGRMPGLPEEGGFIYVIDKGTPAVEGLKLSMPPQSTFSATTGLTVTGTSTATEIHWAAVIPGSVLGEGTIPVKGGKFEFRMQPMEMQRKTPTYDVMNMVTGKPELKDVMHLTLFSRETAPDGQVSYQFQRLIVRGTTVICAR